MKTKFFLALFIFSLLSVEAQNLLDTGSWVENATTSSLPDYNVSGGPDRNQIVSDNNPFGNPAPVWWSRPLTGETYKYLGFKTKQQFTSAQIDVTRDYRYSIWIKVSKNAYITNTLNASNTTYEFELADGTLNSRLSFKNDQIFGPNLGQWYLMVGYIRGTSSTGQDDYDNQSGFYEVQSSVPVLAGHAAGIGKFNTSDPNVSFIFQQYYYAKTDTHEAFFYRPRLEPVDGQEPSISDLTNPNWVEPEAPSGEGGLWSTNANGIHYNGNVGIGNNVPDAPLAVSGRIHAQEVKVTATVPAPDYVFYKDYNLKTLEEIQQYITEHGHLPNIPSAKEIEANGIELGLMNMKLLEKIEELTLYILQQDKEIEGLSLSRIEQKKQIQELFLLINELKSVSEKD